MTRMAIVAALEREVRPLVRNWRVVERDYEGKRFRFFESGSGAVVICGGIGYEAARRAAEAVITLYKPEKVQSVGFAGALSPALSVGDIFSPARVMQASDGSSVNIEGGKGVLLSYASIAGVGQKAKLAEAYGAQALDMEAAAVASSADCHGIRFTATKVISDEFDFEMPAMDRFVGAKGQFQTSRFLAFATLRPWRWAKVVGLAWRSAKAAKALCLELEKQMSLILNQTAELDSSLRV